MSSPAYFRYPGDEPSALEAVADQIDQAGVRIERLIEAITLSRGALKKSWTMQATDLADADIGTLVSGLPAVRSALTGAQSAVVIHQAELVRIRREIDELQAQSRRQQNAYEAAAEDYRRLEHSDNPAAVEKQNRDVAAARAASDAMEEIAERYRELVQEADTSTQACADAMTSAWDPQRKAVSVFGLMLSNPGNVLLSGVGITASSLNMLRIDAEVAEASSIATEIDEMQFIDATDPAIQAKFARLAEIWNSESANGVFATAFYDKLGADNTVDLMARVATVIQPPESGDYGPLNQALLHDLQADMANGLSAAMQGIELNPAGSLQDTTPGGLSGEWVTAMMAKGRSDVTVPWNDVPIQVKGYVPLMATLAAGGGYSAGVLQALGDDMQSLELGDGDNPPGASVWTDTAGVRVRWNWGVGGYGFPMGNDPFTSWTSAMVASPGASTAVLANDLPLLNHLLNNRDWSLRDSGDATGAAQWHYGMVDKNERLEGLSLFGDALPQIIGTGSGSADAAKAFDNTVHLLGSRDSNHRIDTGTFQETDWIPPELRPGLGDLLVLNADKLNEVMANPNINDLSVDNDYYRVVADVAKAPALDNGGSTFIDRMVAAEKAVINAETSANTLTPSDLDAQARIAATMAHGHDAQNIGLQQASDAAHNDKVSAIAGAVELAVDTSATPMRWSKEIYKAFGGDLVQIVAGNFMHDTSLAAVGSNADWSGALRSSVSVSASDQWYAYGFDALPAPDPTQNPEVHLYGADGNRLAWSALDNRSREWVTGAWPAGIAEAPENYGSDATTVFDAQESHLNDKVLKYPDGTG